MENQGILVGKLRGDSAGPQNSDLEWASVWGAKVLGFPKENQGILVGMLTRNSAGPQNSDLELASVWGAKV